MTQDAARQALDAARPAAVRALERLALHGRTARVRERAMRTLQTVAGGRTGAAGVRTPGKPAQSR